MKNAQKRQRWTAFMTLLFLTLLAQTFQSYSQPVESVEDCACPQPVNISLAGKTSDSISVSWGISGTPPGSFNVYYYRSEDEFTSEPVVTSNLNHTFLSLPAGTYDIHVEAVCGSSGGVVVVDIIL